MDCLPQLHLAALHTAPGYRVATPGLGLLCRTDADVIGGAGVYANSNGNASAYLMAGWQPIDIAGVKLGVFFGAVNGYRRGDGGFVPIGGLAATWGHFNLIAWPKADAQSSAGVGLSITVYEHH